MSSLNIPWLIIGDFNTILTNDEYKGGRFSYYHRKSNYFLNFIDANNLFNLHFIGPRFTWCNNQIGLARRWARLDCCLVNLNWSSKFSNYSLRHLPRIHLDHAPFFLTINLHNLHKRSIFHFANYWLDYLGCHLAVKNVWFP